MFDVAFLTGAVIGCGLLTALGHFLSRNWPLSYGKTLLINANVLVFAVLFSAIGASDGGPPNFSFAPHYFISQCIILVADLIRTRGFNRVYRS